jgi:NTP pyrophosphatase (non-canonical NTP hydrolase)
MKSDRDTTIQELKDRVEQFVQARDWDVFHHPKELAISICIEAAELLEIFQWVEKEPTAKLKERGEVIDRIREELADVIDYCIGLANRLDIDISQAVLEKMDSNEERYPAREVKGRAKGYIKSR